MFKIILGFLNNSSPKQNLLVLTVIPTKLKCVLGAAADILADKYDGRKGPRSGYCQLYKCLD